jgi:hypothetical protein
MDALKPNTGPALTSACSFTPMRCASREHTTFDRMALNTPSTSPTLVDRGHDQEAGYAPIKRSMDCPQSEDTKRNVYKGTNRK